MMSEWPTIKLLPSLDTILRYSRILLTKGVCGLAYSKDGKYLASGSNDNRVMVWADRETQPVHTLIEHSAAVKALAWSPHSKYLLATGGGSQDRQLCFWNASAGELNPVVAAQQGTGNGARVPPEPTNSMEIPLNDPDSRTNRSPRSSPPTGHVTREVAPWCHWVLTRAFDCGRCSRVARRGRARRVARVWHGA
eukprot:sb/3470971/